MNLAKVVVKRIERKRVNMVLNLFGESQRQAGKASIGDGEAVAGGELWRPADDSRRRVASVTLRLDASSRSFNARQFT